MRIHKLWCAAMLLAAGAAPPVPAWLFPPLSTTVPRPPIPLTLAGSALHPTADDLETMSRAVDWYPGEHAHAPPVVLNTGSGASACGYCHLAGGGGRPENASIAGLDAEYIRRSVKAYASGTRGSADPGFLAFTLMRQTAMTLSDADLDAAAAYYAAQPRHAFGKVVETATIPTPVGDSMTWRRDPAGGQSPLGQRLIEMPNDFGRFKARDPHMGYTAYVPPGSIARGAALTQTAACATCHGADYNGTPIAPPLAGRSPTYIARQLVNYRSGARHANEAQPMLAIAAGLTDTDVIALAAYMGSRAPGPRGLMPQ